MKAMKKVFILTLIMVMGAVLHGQAFAKGGFGRGMDRSQAVNGEPVVVTGAVAEIGYYGRGVQIDNGTEIITVYGLGPVWYWEQLDVSYPVVTDKITVNASKVTFSDGTEKIVALSVVIADNEIALRDAETGLPLWHKQGFRGNRSNVPCRAIPAEVTE